MSNQIRRSEHRRWVRVRWPLPHHLHAAHARVVSEHLGLDKIHFGWGRPRKKENRAHLNADLANITFICRFDLHHGTYHMWQTECWQNHEDVVSIFLLSRVYLVYILEVKWIRQTETASFYNIELNQYKWYQIFQAWQSLSYFWHEASFKCASRLAD